MALQPKSSNIPEAQAEPNAAAQVASPKILVPGSENAVAVNNENLKSPLEERKQIEGDEIATPQREKKTPKKEAKPVLGQQ